MGFVDGEHLSSGRKVPLTRAFARRAAETVTPPSEDRTRDRKGGAAKWA